MVWITKTITALLLPPGVLLVLLAAALVQLRLGRRRGAAFTVATAALLLYLLAIAPVRQLLLAPLERQYSEPPREQLTCQAIAVLGGGAAARSDPEGALPALSQASTERVLTAFVLWRDLRVPVLLSGGTSGISGAPEAPAMADVLARLGVPDRALVLEWWSENTYGNGTYVKSVAAAFGWSRLCLVTSAWHMPRAARTFRALEMEIVPVPAGKHDYAEDGWGGWAPSLETLQLSTLALREYLALVWYRLRYGV